MNLLAGGLLWGGWLCGLLALLTWWKAEKHRVAVRTALMRARDGPGNREPPCGPPTKAHVQVARTPALPGWLLRAADSLADRAGNLTLGGDLERWERLLTLAGRPYWLTAHLLGGLRLVATTAGLIFGNLLSLIGFPLLTPVILAGAGYFGPLLWLQGRARERQARIGRSLPDFLDTVACALEAGGLGLDQALERAVIHFEGPLPEEIGRLLQETALGMPRRLALQGLLDRTACRELELLAQALMQAEAIGAPVARAFGIQAEAIRSYRAQGAREAAARVESKLTGIGTLVLAPISLLFILALLVLNLFYNPAFTGWRSMW